MATILTKKKDTTGAPSAGDLTNSTGGAELAVNTADKRLYTKDSGGNVVEIGTNPTSITTGTLNTSGAVVFNDAGADVDFRVEGDTDANLLFVDASTNRVGIGTNSPDSLTTLSASSGNTILELNRDDANVNGAVGAINFTASDGHSVSSIYAQADGDNEGAHLVFRTTSAAGQNDPYGANTYERIRITAGGNLLVGTTTSTSANFLIETSKSGSNYIQCRSTSFSNNDVVAFNATAGSRESELGIYKHSGITNPAPYLRLQEEDGATTFYWTGNDGNFRISTNPSDIGTNNGTVVGTQSSDERLKNISGSVSYGLNEIIALEPIAFAFKDRPDFQKLGFSAQQVQPIVPEAVYDTGECIDGYDVGPENKMSHTPKSDRTKLAMEYTQLIPVLVNAVKDLKAELDEAKARIAALENA